MASVRNYTLCLIDLQYDFVESISAKCLRNVVREVEAAKAAGREILVVLYKRCGALIQEVAKLLKGYKHYRRIWKEDNDGGPEVTAALGYKPQHVRVCGVNTDACVLETVLTMAQLFNYNRNLRDKRIQVVSDACWSYDGTGNGEEYHSRGIKRMKENRRLEVV